MDRHGIRRPLAREPGPLLGTLGTACLTLLSLAAVATAAEEPGPSLAPLREEAKRLAQSPETRPRAIAEYRSLIEAHLANEAEFQAAVRELADCHEASGWTEEGVRDLLRLAYQNDAAKRHQVFQEVFGRLRLTQPELLERVAKGMGELPGRRAELLKTDPSEAITAGILQRKDPALREKSLEALRKLLSKESSADEKRSGLATLRAALAAKFDRGPFRALVVPLLKSDDPPTRELALGCLPALEPATADVALVVPLAEDASPRVRAAAGAALVAVGKGEQAEQVIPALTRILRDSDAEVVTRTIRSMWGQYSSPEFDKLLVELSRDEKYRGVVVYHALSTMRTKSAAVCRRLVEELADPDWNQSGRAAWGLTYGVVDEAKPLVEEALLKALPEETNDYTREQELRALRGVATEKSRAYLRSVAESNLENEKVKQAAKEILGELDKKH